MWGFGRGNLFERMETTQFGIPGSQSMKVSDIENEQPTTVSAAIVGIDWEADSPGIKDAVVQAAKDISEISGVDTVITPWSFDEALAEVASGQAKIDEAKAQLAEQEASLAAGRSELEAGRAQAAALPAAARAVAEQRLAAVAANLDAAQTALDNGKAELEAQQKTVDEGRDEATKARDGFISNRSDSFVIVARMNKDMSEADIETCDRAVATRMKALEADLTKGEHPVPSARVHVTSLHEIVDAIMDQVKTDLVRGESVSLPVALLILILVFSGLLAATLPMIGALVAIAIATGLMWAMTFTTTVDSYVLNVVTIIGLALSIDYGLLIVSRYREEFGNRLARLGLPRDGTRLPEGAELDDVVRRSVSATVATAGRTVVFSAVTIAISICGLLVMHSTTLRIIAIGGVIVVLLAVLTASTLVPSLIRILGPHLLRQSPLASWPGLRHLFAALRDSSSDTGAFSRLAAGVQKHPWIIMIAIFGALIAMAMPVRDLEMRSNVYEYIPQSASARSAYDTMQRDYPELATDDIIIHSHGTEDEAKADAEWIATVADSVKDPAEVDGIWRIGASMDEEDSVGQATIDAVEAIRAHDFGHEVNVGGSAAQQHDFTASMLHASPIALGIVALAVLVLLFLMTGSIIVPIKALLINILSFVASLGVTVFLFTHGWLGLPHTLGMETIVVACAVAFGFGLSMDYEVFLIARMKEHYDAGHTNDESVAMGLQRSGRIITSAALAIIAVFVGFVFGDMLAIKEIGVLLAICVAVDATLVRLLLVPATMTVLGDWNWWAPGPLKRLYLRFNPPRKAKPASPAAPAAIPVVPTNREAASVPRAVLPAPVTALPAAESATEPAKPSTTPAKRDPNLFQLPDEATATGRHRAGGKAAPPRVDETGEIRFGKHRRK